MERSMKHSSHGEALLLKKPLDDRLHELATHIPELNLASITELEFISNFQAIQVRSWANINTGNATLLYQEDIKFLTVAGSLCGCI